MTDRPGRSRRDPEPLADLVPSLLEDLGLDQASATVRLHRAWGDVLGEDLAAHCSAEGLRRGVVFAAVSDSAWMQRVQLEKPRILSGLRSALEPDEICDLRLRIARTH